jgi:ssDNA thymidine ADP-ribosyltransferase, DarT
MDLDRFVSKVVKLSTHHNHFYHFTDKSNLPMIKEHGLLSTSELKARDLFGKVVTGGDANSLDSDYKNGTDKFVCLCFTDSHPMSYVAAQRERKLNPSYLRIDPEVIKLPGVMITTAASNQTGVKRMEASVGLDELDLPVIYTWTNWRDSKVMERLKLARKYEILVPTSLATNYIVKGI